MQGIENQQGRAFLKKTRVQAVVLSQLVFILILPFVYPLTHYINVLALPVFWACLTLGVYVVIHVLKKEPIEIKAFYWTSGFVLYSVCLFILLFDRPEQSGIRTYNLVPLKTILFYFKSGVAPLVAFYNLAANIGLFIPYGFLLMALVKKRRVVVLSLIPVFSISIIESLQFVTRRGQLDIDDLILNVLGFVIGYSLYPLLKRYLILKGSNRDEEKQAV